MDDMDMRPPRLLVADDDESVREVTREMLRALAMEVDSVRAGGELVDHYRRSMLAGRRYDLVILGIYQPLELGGGAVANMLLELDPEAKVLVSAAMVGGDEFPSRKLRGIVGYLDRPYRMQDLVRSVREALRSDVQEGPGRYPGTR